VGELDPEFDSFKNINTPGDYFELRKNEREVAQSDNLYAVPAEFSRAVGSTSLD
jgi:hypothetical protein